MGTGMHHSIVGARAHSPLTRFAPGRQAGGPLRSPAAGWLLHCHVMALMTITSLDCHDTISLFSLLPSSPNFSGSLSSSPHPLIDDRLRPFSDNLPWGDERPRRSLTCPARTSEKTCARRNRLLALHETPSHALIGIRVD